MSDDQHFLPPEKLINATGKKLDQDVIKNIQLFTEKMITDIINRSTLLCRHKGGDTISAEEISMIIEKDFDYSFGLRTIISEKRPPAPEHHERMAELSRQR